jgi:hypothetical protein
VLDRRLADREFIAGGLSRPSVASAALGLLPGGLSRPSVASEALGLLPGEFSIADIACYPWIVPHRGHGQNLDEFPHLRRWFETIRARPATQRVYAGVDDVYARPQSLTAEARRVLFGQSATG